MLEKSIVDRARNSDIITFLERYHSFSFSSAGNEYRCNQHKSLSVKADRLTWYWRSKGVGGYGALDYLIKMENMPFIRAVEILVGNIPQVKRAQSAPTTQKTLVLPEARNRAPHLYNYLCDKRSINYDLVLWLTQKKKIYEDVRGNIVFVGHDEQGIARFASLRGTRSGFRGDCSGSDKRYAWIMPGQSSKRLYVFESPIDCMSHATLVSLMTNNENVWKQHTRLSLAGTSDVGLFFFLSQPNQVRELVFCLDNDKPGQEATALLAKKYAEKGYFTRIVPPQRKDFNEDLVEYRNETVNVKGAR